MTITDSGIYNGMPACELGERGWEPLERDQRRAVRGDEAASRFHPAIEKDRRDHRFASVAEHVPRLQ